MCIANRDLPHLLHEVSGLALNAKVHKPRLVDIAFRCDLLANVLNPDIQVGANDATDELYDALMDVSAERLAKFHWWNNHQTGFLDALIRKLDAYLDIYRGRISVPPLQHLSSKGAESAAKMVVRRMEELFFLLMLEFHLEWETCFIGHPLFISTHAAFKTLIHKFDCERLRLSNRNLDDASRKQSRHIQLRVIEMIKAWLSNEHVLITANVLDVIEKFGRRIHVSGSDQAYIDEMVSLKFTGQKVISSLSKPSSGTFTKPTAPQLAAALTRLEKEHSKPIVAAEYVASACGLPSEGLHLQDALDLNERITRWVQYTILCNDKHENRSQSKSFFLATAKECKKIRNFASMCAILVALDSDYIKCLTLTHNTMSRKERKAFEKFRLFISPKSNYKAYRAALEYNLGRGCIPWYHAHLSEIRTIAWERKTHVLDLPAVFGQMSLMARKAMDPWGQSRGLEYTKDGIDNALGYLREEFKIFESGGSLDLKAKMAKVMESEIKILKQRAVKETGFGRASR